jgi:hypothetical protein
MAGRAKRLALDVPSQQAFQLLRVKADVLLFMHIMARHAGQPALRIQIPLQRDVYARPHPNGMRCRCIDAVAARAQPIDRILQDNFLDWRATTRHAHVAFLAAAFKPMTS